MESDQLLSKLSELDERNLVRKVLIPLLERMGFDQIENRHGVHEKGVDLLCITHDEVDDLDILAVQAKRLRFTGNAQSGGHLQGTLNQLSQCIEEPIKLKDGTQRLPNRVWLVSPYPLNVAALESSFAKYSNAIVRRLKIIDGPRLVTLLRDKAPEILAELGDAVFGYRERVAADLSLMHEASALHIRDKVNLIPLYVHLDVSCVPPYILNLIKGNLEPSNLTQLDIEGEDRQVWVSFARVTQRFLGKAPIAVKSTPGVKTRKGRKLTVKLKQKFFYDALLKKSKSEVSALKRGLRGGKSQAAFGLTRFYDFLRGTVPIVSHEAVSFLLNPTRKPKPLGIERLHVSVEAVLDARVNVQIVGDAGAGKTTLLRMMGHRLASQGKRLPVFVPLFTINQRYSLLDAIHTALNSFGLRKSTDSIQRSLRTGEIVLLLDGLDEAAPRADSVGEEIERIVTEYPTTQCIFSSRLWAQRKGYRWLRLGLFPFTPMQLNLFFRRWFAREPLLAESIIDHFRIHPELYRVVSTPLLATTFAALKSSGGELPTSELGLHEGRLRLLLHDWDAVKGLSRDRFDIADKRFFLRKFAWHLHSSTERRASWDKAMELAQGNLGGINNKSTAEAFLHELVYNNNVLFTEDGGGLSLGHLQFQEYLVALEARENPAASLAPHVVNGWWRHALRIYAEMTRDVSRLVRDAISISELKVGKQNQVLLEHVEMAALEVLNELVNLAPNTKANIRALIEKEWTIRRSFGETGVGIS